MNLRDLRYITALADTHHFGQAAEREHVSQPTLSMQIKKLEEYLGVTIFERHNKQVLITPIGEEIIARAKRIIADSDALISLAKAEKDPLSGVVRLGLIPTVAPYLLPHIMPALREAFPRLTFYLREEKTDTLLALLKQGELDGGILALPTEDDAFTSQRLYREPFTLAVSARHPLARRHNVTMEDLDNQEIMLLEEGHCLRKQALDVCSSAGALEQSAFRATSLETLRQMVASGVGITFMPSLAAKQEDTAIRYVPFKQKHREHACPHREIGAIWRKSAARKTALEAIATQIHHVMRSHSI